MTFCEVTYRYQKPLPEKQLKSVDLLQGQVYGMRRIEVDSARRLIRVEFDASRVKMPEVEASLRRAGVAIVERLQTT